jgi:sugar lactone lactonase YvrE
MARYAFFATALVAATVSAAHAHPAFGAQRTLQQMSHPAVDSAGAARTAAREASRSSNATERVRLMQRATEAWPTQPAYWQMLERAALAANDTANAHRARGRLEALDVGSSRVQPDSVQAMFIMADSLDYMESIAWDATGRALLLTEMRRGTVWRMSARGPLRDLRLDTVPGMSAIWAVRAAPDGRSLFVSAAPMAPYRRAHPSSVATAALWQIDSESGVVVRRWALPDSAAEHAPGDVQVLRDGRVLVSDAATAALYVLHTGTGRVQTIRHPLLRSPQGMVELPADRAGASRDVVLLADYSHGLLRIALSTGEVRRVNDAPDRSVLGLDGLAWHKGQLVAVQNGVATPRVVVIALDHEARQVRDVVTIWRDTSVLVSPTTLASDGEALWLFTNTQWDDYAPDGSRVVSRPLRAARVARLSGLSRR